MCKFIRIHIILVCRSVFLSIEQDMSGFPKARNAYIYNILMKPRLFGILVVSVPTYRIRIEHKKAKRRFTIPLSIS